MRPRKHNGRQRGRSRGTRQRCPEGTVPCIEVEFGIPGSTSVGTIVGARLCAPGPRTLAPAAQLNNGNSRIPNSQAKTAAPRTSTTSRPTSSADRPPLTKRNNQSRGRPPLHRRQRSGTGVHPSRRRRKTAMERRQTKEPHNEVQIPRTVRSPNKSAAYPQQAKAAIRHERKHRSTAPQAPKVWPKLNAPGRRQQPGTYAARRQKAAPSIARVDLPPSDIYGHITLSLSRCKALLDRHPSGSSTRPGYVDSHHTNKAWSR